MNTHGMKLIHDVIVRNELNSFCELNYKYYCELNY